MTWLPGMPEGNTNWERLAALSPTAADPLSDVVIAAWDETDPVLLELARLRIANCWGTPRGASAT